VSLSPKGPSQGNEDQNRELGVSGALHDVSNALTVLLGWIAEARADGASRETVDYALDVIERRARMARDLSRRAIGAAPPDAGEADVDAIVDDVLASLRVEAEHSTVKLARLGAAPMARVSGASDVSHVLTNLLLNALAHAPSRSTIWVGILPTETTVVIEVVDEGPGVAPARALAVFEGDSTRKGGAGVGLRHARAVARLGGGDLELVASLPTADSSSTKATQNGINRDAGARGARFRLTWLRSDVRIPPPPPSLGRVRSLEGKRVLLVEDDSDVIDLLETALGARGANVTVARTSAELALALAPGANPPHDAALFDLSPIVDDVAGALSSLAAHSPGATIVLITGSVGGLSEPISSDSVRWVRKPFEVGEVVSALAIPTVRNDDT
jgi:ActR/RegA family two-component response regulator